MYKRQAVYISGIMYQVPGTWYRVQTDRRSLYVVSLFLLSPYHTKKTICFFFLIRFIRNYICLHEFKNEVTNRRDKKTPFLNLKKIIRNGLRPLFLFAAVEKHILLLDIGFYSLLGTLLYSP